MSNNKEVKTTGHVWDEDLEEYNNPLPRWWLWTFYGTIIFSLIYWVMYPTFPIGKGYTPGLATLTYTNDKGEEVTTPWNTRYLLLQDMKHGASAVKQKEYKDKVAKASYQEIIKDPDMLAFTRSYSKVIFADNCASCHQAGGAGVQPFFPNLADDSWLFGGTFERINETIRVGRQGNMPEHGSRFSDEQINDIATYVMQMGGDKVDAASAEKGKALFSGAAACFACHGADGKGNHMIGAPNLTDNIWSNMKINASTDAASKKAMIASVIKHGATRKMPAWAGRLSDADIKMLTVYVHELGGGQ